MKREYVIIDEHGLLPVSYELAAEMLGVKVQTLRNKACAWGKENPEASVIPLAVLRPQAPRTIMVIDDRENPSSTEPFAITVVRMEALSGLSRSTLFKRLGEWREDHPGLPYGSPVPLKAFLKYAMTYKGKPGRPRIPFGARKAIRKKYGGW